MCNEHEGYVYARRCPMLSQMIVQVYCMPDLFACNRSAMPCCALFCRAVLCLSSAAAANPPQHNRLYDGAHSQGAATQPPVPSEKWRPS